MPIFEYKCDECGQGFEKLVFGTQEVACPNCNAKKIKKKFSVFGMSGVENPASSACSSCSSASCSSCK